MVCILTFSWPIAAHTQPEIDILIPDGCQDGVLSDQIIWTCLPDPLEKFNGGLLVYAHGYVDPQEKLALPLEELQDFLPAIGSVLGAGFAFATTSCSKNGYAIEQCGDNINDLVEHFKTEVIPPDLELAKVFVVGASEGGVVATMLVERFPHIYAGGLAMCGPIGGMPFHIRYLSDFRFVRLQGRGHHLVTIPVNRFGHCNFEVEEVLSALTLLVLMAL